MKNLAARSRKSPEVIGVRKKICILGHKHICILSSLPREPMRHGQAALTPRQNPTKKLLLSVAMLTRQYS